MLLFMIIAVAALIITSVVIPVLVSSEQASAQGSTYSEDVQPVSDRFGVVSPNLGIYNDPVRINEELQAMYEAGTKWVRFNFAWTDFQPNENDPEYWYYDGHDLVFDLIENFQLTHPDFEINVLGTLRTAPGWANGGHYSQGVWPIGWYPPDLTLMASPDESLWQEYVRTVCTTYADDVAAWEVWNEPDTQQEWATGADPSAYMELLIQAEESIRAADPDAKVVLGGISTAQNYWPGTTESFLHECLEQGAANYVDVINFHNNNDISVGNLKLDLTRDLYPWLQQLAPGRDVEVWVTENGIWHNQIPDEDDHASYALHNWLTYASEDVDWSTTTAEYADKVFYYNLRDQYYKDPVTGIEFKDYHGLLHWEIDVTPYPAYNYYKTFLAVLGDVVAADPAAVSFTIDNPSSYPEQHAFLRTDGDLVIAAWVENANVESAVLGFTVNDPNYGIPMEVNLTNGEKTPIPPTEFTHDAQGRVVVSNFTIDHVPRIIELDSTSNIHVFSITPTSAAVNTNAEITDISGAGFQPDATVRLEKGTTIIYPSTIDNVSSSQIACTFDLTNQPEQYYDVVVTNPGDGEARLVDGFGVAPPGCGTGSGTAVLMLGLTLGLLSMAGSNRLRKLFRRK